MRSKKIFLYSLQIIGLCCLSSWIPTKHEQPKSLYLTHQKNRLAEFAKKDGFIWFNDKNPYAFFLSNQFPVCVRMWNMHFSSAEGAFQAGKFLHRAEIAVQFTHVKPEKAAKFAQKHSDKQRGDWYKVREEVMLEVLRAKFAQHSDLVELLLATGDAYLVENNRHPFWTDGGDGKGKNCLGNLLMQVRKEFGGTGIVPEPIHYQELNYPSIVKN